MHRCLLASLVCAGCTSGPPANAELAELLSLRVGVQIWESTDREPTKGFFMVGYDEDAFRRAHDGECAVVDIDAHFDGADLGHVSGGGNDTDFDDCYSPGGEFEIDRIGEQAATLRVSDGSRTIEATFSAAQLAPHQPTLRSPSEWKFGGGDAVVLGWSHPDDFVTGADFLDNPVYFHTGTLDDPNFFDIYNTQLVGDEIRFTIPNPPPIKGSGLIVARFGYAVGNATSCVGAASCTFSREAGYAHSVEILDR